MLDYKTFPNGRHRNKTYLQVFQNDEEFCKMVLKGGRSSFIPEDFKDFLTRPTTSSLQGKIEEDEDILRTLTTGDHRSTLDKILGDIKVKVKQLHPPCNKGSNGFIGKFHRVFIEKCVFNLTDTDGYHTFIDNYASVFPFHVSNEINRYRVKILDDFDEELWNEMQTFVNEHFDDVMIRSISHVFFANILNFKENNFSEGMLSKLLKNFNIEGLSMRNDENKSFMGFRQTKEKCDYLKDFPRLSKHGAVVYNQLYNLFVSVSALYGEPCVVSADKYRFSYLTRLPEMNFYELYSLLNSKFLITNRREYVYRFQKYLFFFINALNSESKPVFFIDDVLFECMKSLRTFRKSRDDVFSLKRELAAMSVIARRREAFHNRHMSIDLDEVNLQHVKEYVLNFPNISTAAIKPTLDTNLWQKTVLLSTDDSCLDTCVSKKRRTNVKDFYELIFYAAFSPKDIKRLVIYNAFYGEECSIAMPEDKEALVDFVRTVYNNHDFSRPLAPAPEKFLTHGREKYFQGDVANWDSRSVYKAF